MKNKKLYIIIFAEVLLWVLWISRNTWQAIIHNPDFKESIFHFKIIEFSIGLTYILLIIQLLWFLERKLTFRWFVFWMLLSSVFFSCFYMIYVDTFSSIFFEGSVKINVPILIKSLVGNWVYFALMALTYFSIKLYFDYFSEKNRSDNLNVENTKLKSINLNPQAKNDKQSVGYEDNIFLKDGKKVNIIIVKQIKCICSEGNYSKVYLSNKEIMMVFRSMKYWEQILPPGYFIRVHHSTIVNVTYTLKIENWFKNSYRIYIKDIDTPFEISRRKLASLNDSIK